MLSAVPWVLGLSLALHSLLLSNVDWTIVACFLASFPTSEGVLTLPTRDTWPIIWIHWLKRVEPFLLRIYHWSTAWPIKILENNTSLRTLCYTLPCSLSCSQLKQIIFRITFREKVALHFLMVNYYEPLSQTVGIDTCAIALHCIMLILTYYIKS